MASPVVPIQRVANPDGIMVPPARAIKLGAGLRVTTLPDVSLVGATGGLGEITGCYLIEIDPGAFDTINVEGASSFTDVSITGTLTIGPAGLVGARKVTTADAVVPLLALPLPTDSIASYDLRIVATDGVKEYSFAVAAGGVFRTFGGVPGATITTVETSQASKALAFPPTVDQTWAAGTLTITGMGPSVTVAGIADNGAGKIRVTVAGGGAPLGTALTGKTVTGVGIGGTTEALGDHVATWHSDTEFDLAAVTFSNAWTSGGTFTLTTPPTLQWSIFATLVTATAP